MHVCFGLSEVRSKSSTEMRPSSQTGLQLPKGFSASAGHCFLTKQVPRNADEE